MTYTVVKETALGTFSSGTGSIVGSGTWSPLTVAGNLLIFALFFPGATTPPSVTPASGFLHAVSAAGASAWVDIWYYPNNPGGLGSGVNGVVFNVGGYVLATGGGFNGVMMELHDSAGSNPAPLDVTGSKTGTASPEAIATASAVTAAHEFAVVASAGFYSATTKDTLAAGSGFTLQSACNNATKSQVHYSYDANLDTGTSLAVVTDSVTFTGPFASFAGAIATFQVATAVAAGPPPRVVAFQAPLASSGASPVSRPSFT